MRRLEGRSLPQKALLLLVCVAAVMSLPARGFGLQWETLKEGGKSERGVLRIGISVAGPSRLPVYLAAQNTFREEGLNVEIIHFQGPATVGQALASDSVDVALLSLNHLLLYLGSNLKVKAFYVAFDRPIMAWLSKPGIVSWKGLQHRVMAITRRGDFTDLLTRYVLRKHGLQPEADVKMLSMIGSGSRFTALKSGAIDAAILVLPFDQKAQREGFHLLGTQDSEVGDWWPNAVFVAKFQFIDEHVNTLRSLLRAYVKAIRLWIRHPKAAIEAIMKNLNYERFDAERAYERLFNRMSDRGDLPAHVMPVFWEVVMAVGDIKEPLPKSRFFDRRFVDTFNEWAPRQ